MFSWFPGYSWQIINCAHCYSHLGWQFRALDESSRPRSFYGLTQKAIVSSSFEEYSSDSDSEYMTPSDEPSQNSTNDLSDNELTDYWN